MRVKKTCGALLLGLVMTAAVPVVAEAGHRHHRHCGHRVGKAHVYEYRPHTYGGYYSDRYYADRRYADRYSDRYYSDRYYDDVDYDAPYVARHGSGRGYYGDDYRPSYRSRSYYAPRYHGARRFGYHYHGGSRCFRPDRPHVYFSLRLF